MFHGGEIVIHGLHLSEVPGILEVHGFKIERTTVMSADSFKAVASDFGRRVLVSYCEEGWTHVFDPELTLPGDDELWTRFTQIHRTRALGWIVETTSNTLALWDYERGELRRELVSVDGNVSERGSRIPEEGEIEWSDASALNAFGILESLGAPYRELKGNVEYHVYDVTD